MSGIGSGNHLIMGKGDSRRPSRISKEEENIRFALALGKISFKTFEKRYKELKKQGKIWRK